MGRVSTGIIAILLAIAGFAYWTARSEHEQRKEAELQLGLESSKIISVSFQQKSDLTVYRMSGNVVAKVDCQGTIFHPEQTTKAPATVAYSLPLSEIKESAYSWNQGQQRLTINIPDVHVEPPNVDISKQVVRQNGRFISRECGLVMARKTAVALTGRARAEANKPANIANAREAARKAVADLAAGLLRGTEMRGVTIAVLLPGEAERILRRERWDETRPLVEVLSR